VSSAYLQSLCSNKPPAFTESKLNQLLFGLKIIRTDGGMNE
jgi:hypothetical protein